MALLHGLRAAQAERGMSLKISSWQLANGNWPVHPDLVTKE